MIIVSLMVPKWYLWIRFAVFWVVGWLKTKLPVEHCASLAKILRLTETSTNCKIIGNTMSDIVTSVQLYTNRDGTFTPVHAGLCIMPKVWCHNMLKYSFLDFYKTSCSLMSREQLMLIVVLFLVFSERALLLSFFFQPGQWLPPCRYGPQ